MCVFLCVCVAFLVTGPSGIGFWVYFWLLLRPAFPWGCKGPRFNPRSRKIVHASEQLSPCTATTEARALEPGLHNKRGHCSEKAMHHK